MWICVRRRRCRSRLPAFASSYCGLHADGVRVHTVYNLCSFILSYTVLVCVLLVLVFLKISIKNTKKINYSVPVCVVVFISCYFPIQIQSFSSTQRGATKQQLATMMEILCCACMHVGDFMLASRPSRQLAKRTTTTTIRLHRCRQTSWDY